MKRRGLFKRRAIIPPVTTNEELYDALVKYWGIRIPRDKVCANHDAPFTALADAYFGRSPVALWIASRGFGGKSFMAGVLGVAECAILGADKNILGGSEDQAAGVYEYANDRLWKHKNAPRALIDRITATRTYYARGNRMKVLTASQKSVRGPHPQRLHIDEVDEVTIELVNAAQGQPMSRGGISSGTVYSSTHHNADGTVTELKRRAADKGWPVYQWCWRECIKPHGWLDPDEVDRKRIEIPQVMWDAEYELNDPVPDSLAINREAVERMFKREMIVNGVVRPTVYKGALHELIEIEQPVEGASYVHSADWARSTDYTIILTWRIDVRPIRLVAFERAGRESWPSITQLAVQRMRKWGGSGQHDATGLGTVVDGFLEGGWTGFVQNGAPYWQLLSDYIAAVENGELEAPFIEYMYNEHKFASYESVFTNKIHLPDTISAGALGRLAAEIGNAGVSVRVLNTKRDTTRPFNHAEIAEKLERAGTHESLPTQLQRATPAKQIVGAVSRR